MREQKSNNSDRTANATVFVVNGRLVEQLGERSSLHQ